MADDLVAFLLARVAEDERYLPDAIDSTAAPWFHDGTLEWRQRLARTCEAKRHIVAEFTFNERQMKRFADSSTERVAGIEGRIQGLLMAIAALASTYSDHPDYRDEWRA